MRRIQSIFYTVFTFLYAPIFFLWQKCFRISNKSANELGYHQISDFTEYNRYPEIFEFVKCIFRKDTEEINILSFGCSHGEECFSLRKYFNNAWLTGYDISKRNIEIAIKNNTDKCIYFTSLWEDINKNNYYDIIFAMSVLCRSPHTQNKMNCSKIYSFKQFNDQIILLDKLIKVNGILVLYNANFLFTETAICQKYQPIAIPDYDSSGVITKFDKYNKRLTNQNYIYSLFVKISK